MQYVNDIFGEFAACFAGTLTGEGQIAHPKRLDRRSLDYSIESLKVVDGYLEYLHKHKPAEAERVPTALWGGAYVGEAIRRNARRQYNWADFDDFVAQYPETKRLLGSERQLGFTALLTPGGASFTMPVNKVLRFIADGPADSVWYYAAVEVKRQ